MKTKSAFNRRYCIYAFAMLMPALLLAAIPPGTVGFAPPQTYSVGTYPESIAIGDFNSDGVPDIAVASHNQNRIDVLLGNGDGTFRSAKTVETADGPFNVSVGDFTRHRRADLAVLCGNDPNVYVILGNGDGTFRAPAAYKINDNHPRQVIIADLNHDGIPDLAVASGLSFDYSPPGKLTVFIGVGDGSFRNPVITTVETNPYSFTVGDFDGDGLADIAITTLQNAHPDHIDFLRGNGDGTFQPPRSVQTVAGPIYISSAHLNSNRVLDLIVVGNTEAQILLGNGDGTFTPKSQLVTASHVANLEVADFDGDGKVDILAGTNLGAEILLGNGGGSFQPGVTVFKNSLPLVFWNYVAVGDFQGHKKPDFAVISPSGHISNPGRLSVLVNTSK